MDLKYKGLEILITDAAMRELFKHGCDDLDILEILKEGYDCSRSKRAKNIIEKCIDIKKKTMKVVVAQSYNHALKEEVWVVTHFGITTKRK